MEVNIYSYISSAEYRKATVQDGALMANSADSWSHKWKQDTTENGVININHEKRFSNVCLTSLIQSELSYSK